MPLFNYHLASKRYAQPGISSMSPRLPVLKPETMAQAPNSQSVLGGMESLYDPTNTLPGLVEPESMMQSPNAPTMGTGGMESLYDPTSAFPGLIDPGTMGSMMQAPNSPSLGTGGQFNIFDPDNSLWNSLNNPRTFLRHHLVRRPMRQQMPVNPYGRTYSGA